MPKRLLLILMASSFAACRAGVEEDCPLPDTKGVAKTHPECQFYMGTSHFRAEEYAEAAVLWRAVIDRDRFPKAHVDLKWKSYNNLGYLLFYGLGIREDRELALRYWRIASRNGNEESKFHLCHAYADPRESLFDPVEGLAWCRAAEPFYARRSGEDAQDIQILESIRENLSGLPERMTPQQIQRAEVLAQEYRAAMDP